MDFRFHVLTMSFTLLLVTGCATQPTISWSGQTSALPILKADTVYMILPLAQYATLCHSGIHSINTEIVRVQDLEVGGTGAVVKGNVIERWTVGLCGRTEQFAVRYVPGIQGGTDIDVTLWNSPRSPLRDTETPNNLLQPTP